MASQAQICRAGNSLIRSDRSNQMSDCERFTQDKWATVSESLRSLMSKERFAQVAHEKWAIRSKFFGLKSYFLYIFCTLKKKRAIRSFFFFQWAMWANRSGCSPKMSNVSKLLWSLTKMSEWVNHLFFKQIAHSPIFSQKTSDSLRQPMSKFPALLIW